MILIQELIFKKILLHNAIYKYKIFNEKSKTREI